MIIAERYAKALFGIARSEGMVAEVGKELRLLQGFFSQSPDIYSFLSAPVYDYKDKAGVVEQIARRLKLSKLTKNFLLVILKKNRMKLYQEIVKRYEGFEDEDSGRVRVQLVLPDRSVNGSLVDKIKDRLHRMTGKEVLLSIDEDSDIIGGVVVKMGDLVLDGSIRSKLMRIKESIKRGVV